MKKSDICCGGLSRCPRLAVQIVGTAKTVRLPMPINPLKKLFGLILTLAMLVGCLRLVAIRWWQVPLDDVDLSSSLAPTLSPGDWVLLWRLTTPGVGALVMCPDPEDATNWVIGRIATLGDAQVRVEKNGNLSVSGQRIVANEACRESKFVAEHPNTGSEVKMECAIETIGGIHHPRGTKRDARLYPHEVDEEVEPGRLFLVSDNRLMPFDSRDFGTLDPQTCMERLFFRLGGAKGMGDVETRLSWIP